MRFKILFLILLISQVALAQTKDSTKVRKNLRFSLLGGPGYTPDYGLVIGGSALLTFSTDTKDSTLKRSVLPLAFGYMFNGGGSAFLRPQIFLKHDKFRIFGVMSFNYTWENYYGIGFEQNTNTVKDSDTTQYRSEGFNINPIFLIRFKESDLYYGFSFDIAQRDMLKPSAGVLNDSSYIREGGTKDGLRYFDAGIGINISYDTRDVPANPYRGLLLEAGATGYSTLLGSTNNYGVYTFVYKQFLPLAFIGERKTLAWMLDTRFTSGDVPLTNLSMIGSPFDLRGYYMGQYRDNNSFVLMAEYRSMFNMGDKTWMRRLLSKFGYVVWGGLGKVSPEIGNKCDIMPNYGLGLRIEVQPRMNFRLDVGHDPLNNQTLIYFNMTEAF